MDEAYELASIRLHKMHDCEYGLDEFDKLISLLEIMRAHCKIELEQ